MIKYLKLVNEQLVTLIMRNSKSTLQNISLPPGGYESLSIHKSKKAVKAIFRIYNLKEGDTFITYIPSLEASGYGNTKKEADDMLLEVIDDLFDNLFELKVDQMEAELRKLGWHQDKMFNKRFENTSYVDADGILKNFDLPETTEIEMNMMELA